MEEMWVDGRVGGVYFLFLSYAKDVERVYISRLQLDTCFEIVQKASKVLSVDAHI